jgi:hypothetical protein
VLSNPVCQRRILTEQFAHAVDVAGVTRSRQIDERAARLQVNHDLRGSCRPGWPSLTLPFLYLPTRSVRDPHHHDGRYKSDTRGEFIPEHDGCGHRKQDESNQIFGQTGWPIALRRHNIS